jgi:uncharacterized protein (UPF0332 family)
MKDNAERAIKEAEAWLVSAKDKLIIAEDEEEAANVCCALAIHAIIRANDALCLKFLNLKPTKHDDIPHIFDNIIKEGKIGKGNHHFMKLLEKVKLDKSGADYGKKEFSYEEAKDYVGKAEEFVSAMKGYI